MFLVDSHCHFHLIDDKLDMQTITEIIARAREAGVKYFLNVSVSVKDFPHVLDLAEKHNDISATYGLHPNYQDEEVDFDTIVKEANHPKVVGIGETGLDYFRSTGDLDWQRKRFITHIEAAKSLQKPLVIHMRDASEDTLRIMQEQQVDKVRGVMHCFSEDWEVAKKALDLNFYISFSGIVTFKNATKIQDVAKRVPLERILIETDSPYLAPNPHRGKANEPGYMRHTAEFIANLRGIDLENFAEQTTQNFFDLFNTAVRNQNV